VQAAFIIELAPELHGNFGRIFDPPALHDLDNAAARIREIVQAFDVPETNPLIGLAGIWKSARTDHRVPFARLCSPVPLCIGNQRGICSRFSKQAGSGYRPG
jgi:hypothetical protein